MTSIALSEVELRYWTAKFRGAYRETVIDNAHQQALAWVDQHATNMLPSIRAGLVRNYFRALIEVDTGEKKLLMGAIDALLELGGAIHANSCT